MYPQKKKRKLYMYINGYITRYKVACRGREILFGTMEVWGWMDWFKNSLNNEPGLERWIGIKPVSSLLGCLTHQAKQAGYEIVRSLNRNAYFAKTSLAPALHGHQTSSFRQSFLGYGPTLFKHLFKSQLLLRGVTHPRFQAFKLVVWSHLSNFFLLEMFFENHV